MAAYPKRGYKKAPDNQFYAPDDPIWAIFKAGSATVAEEQMADVAENTQEVTSVHLGTEALTTEQQGQKVRQALKSFGEEEREQPKYSESLIGNLTKPLAPQPKRTLEQQSKRTPAAAELEASKRRREILEGFHQETRRQAKMSPSEFAKEGLGPISATMYTFQPDPSEYFTPDGKRPCEDDESLHWANIRDESNGKETTMNTDRFRRTGSGVVFDETGLPVMRNDCVLMKVKIEDQAWRQAQAMKDATRTAHETALAKDSDQRSSARMAGMTSGPLTFQGGMAIRDPFQANAATQIRPGEIAIE